MKKYTIFLTTLLTLQLLTFSLKAESDLDTVQFWATVNTLLNRAGYDENSEFGRHARTNLRRVETLRGQAYPAKSEGAMSRFARALGWGKKDTTRRDYKEPKRDYRKEYSKEPKREYKEPQKEYRRTEPATTKRPQEQKANKQTVKTPMQGTPFKKTTGRKNVTKVKVKKS